MSKRFRKQKGVRRRKNRQIFSNNGAKRARGDIRIVVGRKRVWIFANNADLNVERNGYVVLELINVYQTKFGKAAELRILNISKRQDDNTNNVDQIERQDIELL